MATLRTLLVRSLWIAAGLLPLVFVTGLTWGWLAALGDGFAAAATRGLLVVLGAVLAVDVLAIIGLTAASAIQLADNDQLNR